MLTSKPLHRALRAAMVMPFVANIAGWLTREIGRQPFVIDDILTTRQALTPSLTTTQLTISLVVLGTIVITLLILDWWLLAKTAMRGPAHADLWAHEPDSGEHPQPDSTHDDERDSILL
jgi:cytochrome d ubiquinol oxidase subunit I